MNTKFFFFYFFFLIINFSIIVVASDHKIGFNKTQFNETEFNKTKFNKTEFNETAFNKTEFNETEFNKTEFKKTEFNKTEFNKTKFNKFEFNKIEFNKTKFNKTEFNETAFNKIELNKTAFNKTEFNKTEFKKTECNKIQFNETAFNKTEFIKTKFNKIEFNKTEFNKTKKYMETWKTYSKASSLWENHTVYYNESSVKQAQKLSTPEECARPCKAGRKPKICHFQWTVEYYHTFGGACKLCKPTTNTSISSDCQCILADGVDMSGIITVNRMYPGPTIQICLGDFVVVDVTNKVTGNAVGIHWHGIYQRDWQHYDGVPFLTQCPINEGSTFRYQWRAQNSGTHFWHAHSGLHKAEGVLGPIIIGQPKSNEPNDKLYDYQGPDYIIFISDWTHENVQFHFPGTTSRNPGQVPDNILVNGKGQFTDSLGNETSTPLAVYDVKPGKRYRIRLINGCNFNCPVQMTIQDHNVTIIAVDGEDVVPRIVTSISSFSAERVDFIINACQPGNRTYWIQFRAFGVCAPKKIQQHAILRYVGLKLNVPQTPKPSYDSPLPSGIIFNEVNEVCDGNRTDVVCVKNLEAIDDIHPRILRKESDMQLYLPFDFHLYDDNYLFEPNTYNRFITPSGNESFGAMMAGISHINPPSPFISQLSDIPEGYICNRTNLPARCSNSPICHCSHVINIPLNAVVDLMLVDVSGPTGISHPFHLHGFGFHVLAQGLLPKVNLTESNVKQGIELDRKEYPVFHNKPPTKDTLAVPSEGYTIVRFIADNPGWWLFHCHFLPHLYNGMALVFHIGDQKDLPPTPEGFPKCGNFVPNIHKLNPKARGKM